MRGRLALAEAEALGPADPGARRRSLRRAAAAARRLERLDVVQARVAAPMLRAGLAFQDGDLDGAREALLRAEVAAHRAELRLMQAAAQRRRGQLIGGSAGDELVRAVDHWADREGVRRPDKFVRMYAPGFDRRR